MGACVHHLVQCSQTNEKQKVNLDWCLFSNPVPQNEFWEKSAEVFKTRPPSPPQVQATPHTASPALKNT